MVYGYARVSTRGQAKDGNSLEAQGKVLKEAGAMEVIADAFTGTKAERPMFSELLGKLEQGDTLIVTKLDRFARNAEDAIRIIKDLVNKGIVVSILNMGIADNTPMGKLMITILSGFAEFERDMIVERTREGKEIARLNPDYQEGRPKKYTKLQIDKAMKLLETNTYTKVVQLTGISKSTLVRARHELASKRAEKKM